MNPTRYLTATLLALSIAALSWAQAQENDNAEAAKQASEKPAEAKSAEGEPPAERVLEDLLKEPTENPVIQPSRSQGDVTAPAKAVQPADAVAGTAPNAKQRTQLKREGTFVITRRGRMVRATGGASPWMIHFESDASGLSDAPMYLMPCQMLEDMEQIVEQQGDSVVFVISGQVFVYHGANYVLPTMMKLAPNRGNLQP